LKVIVKTYPRETEYITLYPIADVHWGAEECMEKEFQAYLKKIAADPSAAVLLAGDLLNNGIKSSKTDVYRERYPPDVQKEMMIDLLWPIRDKIVAGVSGNHEYRTVKESCQDVMKDIFVALQIRDRYEPDAAFVKISLGQKGNKKPVTYMIFMTHGSGGGASGTYVEKQNRYHLHIEGVDIAILGHSHDPDKKPSARLVLDSHNNKVFRRETCIFVCTSWLSYNGYPVRNQYPPKAFRPDTIRLDGRTKEWK